jgi:N-methylhydantoinase A
MGFSLGIDTGGTHTDLILISDDNGQVWTAKVETIPNAPLAGILEGIDQILSGSGVKIEHLDELVYGTTIVVNMLVQHQSMQTGLITTKGFRDVLEIGRAYRTGNIYDINIQKPVPLVPRDLRFQVNERVNFRGEILEGLDEENCRSVARALKEKGVRSIAVCLLHSYANPTSEQRIKEIIHEEFPSAYISLSSEINPVFREYERTSTTAVNAFVSPSMVDHLNDFERQVNGRGFRGRQYTMQANGGKATFPEACQHPVQVINSGPVAGVIAGMYLAKITNYPNVITMDMGGTSCDIALIEGGEPRFATESSVEGYPVQIPTIDLNIVGAGGGSIAWIDTGGGLRVGPQSAGADPGPVCYCKGGSQPTITDANLVTGRLNPDYYLEGRVHLDIEAANRAITEKIAIPLGMKMLEAAAGITEVANATMVRAIKLISVERGYDPHDFTLIAFGGAGPLHAIRLAEELEFPTVIIPRYPGNTSALGLVLADIRHDYVITNIQLLEKATPDKVENAFQELEYQAIRKLDAEGIPPQARQLTRLYDLRYFGQGYEVTVSIPGAIHSREDLDNVAREFHTSHRRAFGHAMEGDPVEMVNFRVRAIGYSSNQGMYKRLVFSPSASNDGGLKGEREVYMRDKYIRCKVYERKYIPTGRQIEGPAVIEQAGSTTLIFPEYIAQVDSTGNLTITLA